MGFGMRTRVRERTAGERTNRGVLGIADKGRRAHCHTGVSGLVFSVSQREMRAGRVS